MCNELDNCSHKHFKATRDKNRSRVLVCAVCGKNIFNIVREQGETIANLKRGNNAD